MDTANFIWCFLNIYILASNMIHFLLRNIIMYFYAKYFSCVIKGKIATEGQKPKQAITNTNISSVKI